MKHFYLLPTLLLFFVACTKEVEPKIAYPSTYHSIRYENFTPVRIFTKNGEITDAQVINRFITRYAANNYEGYSWLYPSNTIATPIKPDTVRIISSNVAQFKVRETYTKENYRDYKLDINNNTWFFTTKDTIPITGTAITESSYKLYESIVTHKPSMVLKVVLPSSSDIIYHYAVVEKRSALAKGDELEFSILNYIVAYKLPFGGSMAMYTRVNNVFKHSAEIYSRLGVGLL